MKKFWRLSIFSMLALAALASCGGKNGSNSAYPEDFNSIGDSGRVKYMMSRVTPDSLARFIIYGALGYDKDARIDTLAVATNYAYEHLRGEDLDKFSSEYDAIIEALPLGDKMKAYQLGGSEDPQRLGYKLGLEYMTSIREGNKSVSDIKKELAEFKKVCGADTAMYRRFIIGFHTVLQVDRGTDVPEEIYSTFVNFE